MKEAKNHQHFKWVGRLFFLTLGAIIMAIGLEMALIPNQLIDGGITGISMMIANLTGIPLGIFLFALNIPFLYLGYKQIGKTFAISALYGIAVLSIVTSFLHHFHLEITHDILLATIVGGVLIGIGVGIAIRAGGCLDGSETLAILFSQKTPLSVGQIILFMNLFILGTAGFLYGFDRFMYSFLSYFIAMKTIDLVTEGFEGTKSTIIISEKSDEIAEAIIHRLGRSVTFLNGKGGYGKEEKTVIYCIIDRLEEAKMKNLVSEIDSNALVAISNVAEIQGGNFKKKDIH